MRNIEKKFKIESDQNPLLSTLVCFGRAVEYQRLDLATIGKWFKKLVDKDDYEPKDRDAILEHFLRLSHSKKQDVKAED